jgi:hypothetical protein
LHSKTTGLVQDKAQVVFEQHSVSHPLNVSVGRGWSVGAALVRGSVLSEETTVDTHTLASIQPSGRVPHALPHAAAVLNGNFAKANKLLHE